VKESDIRPAELFARYLDLCRCDAETFFRGDEWEETACVACGGGGERAFEKHGFRYNLCSLCRTLYASPRPTAAALARYYTSSPSSAFWVTDFYRTTEDARRGHMFKPRAAQVRAAVAALGIAEPATIVDIGAGYGVFCEEIQKQFPRARVIAVEPSAALGTVCRDKGFTLVPAFLEDLDRDAIPSDGATVFTSFELFEHLHDPTTFLLRCRQLMRPGDVLVLTTLSGTGFDIQVLWDQAKAVFPPHHLNFLNPWSLESLARRCGLDDVAVTTPGKLDVDIVKNHGAADGIARFLRTMTGIAGDATGASLQQWLQEQRLSSHMMMVARSGEAGRA
jgi:SAM-dependent methyltransferase